MRLGLTLASLVLLATPVLAQPNTNGVAPLGSASSVPVSVYFQPFEDSEQVALSHLKRAKKFVHVAQYNIRNTRFYDALSELRARGVEVHLACDEDNAAHEWNWLTAQFLSNGFDLVLFKPPTSKSAIMHLKCTVIDGTTVLTGSYNWNNTAQLSNDENMLVIEDAKVAAEYDRYIEMVRAKSVSGWLPKIAAGSPIEVHFAPADAPATKVVKLLDAAKTRVTVGMFTLTDSTVASALKRAKNRGVTVEIVTEAKQATLSSVPKTLAQSGCRVVLGANTSSAFSAMHHKYAVIDDIVVSGACNWTKNGFQDSCEDVLIVRDAGLAKAFRHNWKALIKRYDPTHYDPQAFGTTSTAHVQFIVEHSKTAWGDRVFVTGNHPALGDWDPSKGVELRTADDIFPRWSGSATLPAGAGIEYKFVTLTAAGEAFWENGDNHAFTVDPQGTDEARIESYRY